MMILLLRAIRADIDSKRAYSEGLNNNLGSCGFNIRSCDHLRSKKRQLWFVICP